MKIYYYQLEEGTREKRYIVGQAYNFLYWYAGALVDVRGEVTAVTRSYVQIDVIKED